MARAKTVGKWQRNDSTTQQRPSGPSCRATIAPIPPPSSFLLRTETAQTAHLFLNERNAGHVVTRLVVFLRDKFFPLRPSCLARAMRPGVKVQTRACVRACVRASAFARPDTHSLQTKQQQRGIGGPVMCERISPSRTAISSSARLSKVAILAASTATPFRHCWLMIRATRNSRSYADTFWSPFGDG